MVKCFEGGKIRFLLGSELNFPFKISISIILFVAFSFFQISFARADESKTLQSEKLDEKPGCTTELQVGGTIGAATLDSLQRAFRRTEARGCQSILLLINTPGGSLPTTRMIVEEILNSPVPILCLIYPSGGHAGSAGAIIMQACHVNGAMSATNIGAATPVSSSAQEMPKDLRKKLLNDTASWMDGITELRGRNKKFGREIITEAKAVNAKEAVKIGAIDFLAEKKMDFLNFANGRKVKLSQNREVSVAIGDLQTMRSDLRAEVLGIVTDPQLAYLILMGSLGLIYFEITHPGTMVAGIAGSVGLVVALMSLHKLDVYWGGVLLILLGIAFMVAEVFVPSFGALGVGGVLSFVLGSVFLFDPAETGYQLPWSLILPVALTLSILMALIALLAIRTRNVKKRGAYDDVLGKKAKVVVVSDGGRRGQVEVTGETWKFESLSEVNEGDPVEVYDYEGMILKVKKIDQTILDRP